MAGTFRLRVGIADTNTVTLYASVFAPSATSGPPLATLALSVDTRSDNKIASTGAIQAPFLGAAAYLRFDIDDQYIVLDGGTPINLFEIPAGFHILTATINFAGLARNDAGAGELGSATLEFDPLTVSAPIAATSYLGGGIYSPLILYDYPTPATLSIIDILNNGIGFHLTGANAGTVIIDYLCITGTYDIVSYTFDGAVDGVHIPPKISIVPESETTKLSPGEKSPGYNFPPVIQPNKISGNVVGGMIYISNPSISGSISPGDLIRVTSGDGILDIDNNPALLYTPNGGSPTSFAIPDEFIFVFTPDTIIFMIPPYIELVFEDNPPSTVPNVIVTPVIIVDDPGIFTGPIYLDPLAVLMVNASGIYKLDKTALHDTLYDNTDPPNTVDVAIPDPFAKTGFIGG